MRAFLGKLMFSNNLQRKIPGFEELSVNIFLMRKYAQKNVLGPVLFICYYWKLSNETAAKLVICNFCTQNRPKIAQKKHF